LKLMAMWEVLIEENENKKTAYSTSNLTMLGSIQSLLVRL